MRSSTACKNMQNPWKKSCSSRCWITQKGFNPLQQARVGSRKQRSTYTKNRRHDCRNYHKQPNSTVHPWLEAFQPSQELRSQTLPLVPRTPLNRNKHVGSSVSRSNNIKEDVDSTFGSLQLRGCPSLVKGGRLRKTCQMQQPARVRQRVATF